MFQSLTTKLNVIGVIENLQPKWSTNLDLLMFDAIIIG
jgi:hypothetical protein